MSELLSLPPELLLEIAINLPTFLALRAFALTHPRVHDLVCLNTARICSSVLRSDFGDLYPLALSLLFCPPSTNGFNPGAREVAEMLSSRRRVRLLAQKWVNAVLNRMGFSADHYHAPTFTDRQWTRITRACYRCWYIMRMDPAEVKEMDLRAEYGTEGLAEMREFIEFVGTDGLAVLPGGDTKALQVVVDAAESARIRVCCMNLVLIREWF